jgi:hypothetical protein
MTRKTDYTVLAKFRNKKNAKYLIDKIIEQGYTCYNFFDLPIEENIVDKLTAQEYMKRMESTSDFLKDKYFQKVFQKDLRGLKNAEKIVVLLPAGNSVHIEAGIAYGLGKELILIGKIEKPESLYLIFNKHFETVEQFLRSLK